MNQRKSKVLREYARDNTPTAYSKRRAYQALKKVWNGTPRTGRRFLFS